MRDVRIKLKNGKIVFVKNGHRQILKEIKNLADWQHKIEVYVNNNRNGEARFLEISFTEIAEIF
ncbi:MAG: hypothetical protein AAB411_01605 [Patescibacteria group bacterium]